LVWELFITSSGLVICFVACFGVKKVLCFLRDANLGFSF
jgi:hypothetical protein